MRTKSRKSGKSLRWLYAILLMSICLIAYDPTRTDNTSGDSISPRYWPVSILKYHTWKLEPFRKTFDGVGYSVFWMNSGKDLVPRLGWGLAPFTVPFYAVADLFQIGGQEWTPDRVNSVSRWNAIFLCILGVLFIFKLSAQFASDKVALASAALFALGTWHWSLGAQGITPQTPVVFTHILNTFLLWRICKASSQTLHRDLAFLGILHGVIWAIRPQDIMLAAPAVLAIRELRQKNRAWMPYVLGGLAIFIPVTIINENIYGSILGQYGVIEKMNGGGGASWRLNGLAGFLGVLFSPNRGAIVFFPLLFLIPYFWSKLMPPLRAGWTGFARSPITASYGKALAAGAVIYFLNLCFLIYWHGTWAYGPRYLYNILPYVWPPITLALSEIEKRLKGQPPRLPRWAMIFVIYASLQGIAIHALGHRNYDLYVWNFKVVPVDDRKVWYLNPLMLKDVWDAGSNYNRYPDGYERLKKYGF